MPFYTQHDIITFFAGEASAILDPFSCEVAPEDVAFGDKDACYDINHIGFTQSGDMLYRGKFRYPKEVFSQFPKKVQAIYYNNFTDYRTNDQSSSGSSNNPTSLAPQNDPSEVHNLNGVHDPGEVHDPILIDNTDATGLLEVPISIDDEIPLMRAYKQYEPQGFQTIADKLISGIEYYGWNKTYPEAAALSQKRKQIGFSREEVVMYGGLTCTPCRESDISDPLLTTLFRQENFYNTTQEVYNVITPALKLAEKFITDPALIGYWSTLAFGAREVDEALSSRDGVCRERIIRLTSTAPVSADPDGFVPLTKVPTPEELVRKYEAWVAGGSLLNKLPEDVHIAQALSAGLGGSLRIKTPAELAKVVAERERKFEAEKKAEKNEKKRKEAKARADAAEERKRLERAKGRGSGSGDSKESEL